jgi:hypothetical protein
VPKELELVEERMLAFLLPVIQEYILEQLGELGVGVDALAIVSLSEELNIQCQRQHRPSAFAEHCAGDRVGVEIEAVAAGQNLADHRIDAAEQRLMFQLLVAEPDQRLDHNLVAKRMTETRAIEVAFLAAYRWQYIHSGARHPYFGKVLNGLITETQGQRIQAALATLH